MVEIVFFLKPKVKRMKKMWAFFLSSLSEKHSFYLQPHLEHSIYSKSLDLKNVNSLNLNL